MSITYSIKRLVRDALASDFETQCENALAGIRVLKAFDGEDFESMNIRISTTSADAQVAGGRNLGRWNVTAKITAVTSIDEADNDLHDDLVGAIEWYALRGNGTLSTALTTGILVVDNVMPGIATEMSINAHRFSSQELEIECYAKEA